MIWNSAACLRDEARREAAKNFTIDVPDHRYQDFRAFPDGSVAYPAQGPNDSTVRIVRVMPCSG